MHFFGSLLIPLPAIVLCLRIALGRTFTQLALFSSLASHVFFHNHSARCAPSGSSPDPRCRSRCPITVPKLFHHQTQYATPASPNRFNGASIDSFLGLARRYTKDHEWVDLSADKRSGVVGISEYAAEQLGDVVFVELPESGNWIDQGDTLGAVKSVKSASDINAPIRCKVTAVNELLEEKPATINRVPEDDSNGGGWISRIEVDQDGAKQYEDLMDAEAYKAFVSED